MDKRYVQKFDLHYVCPHCSREFKTSALKEPIQCPFCLKSGLKKVSEVPA